MVRVIASFHLHRKRPPRLNRVTQSSFQFRDGIVGGDFKPDRCTTDVAEKNILVRGRIVAVLDRPLRGRFVSHRKHGKLLLFVGGHSNAEGPCVARLPQ